MVKFKDFYRPLSVFQVLFMANLFSRTFQDSPVYSSTFQACVHPAGLTECWSRSGSKSFDTLITFLKEFLKKLILKKVGRA